MASAPGPPPQQIGPYVAAGRKDLVTTSLGPGRIWATLGQGIPTEIFWPTPAEVQTRDLGFIIADGTGWWVELKAAAAYTVEWADPKVPVATVVHTGPADHPYRFELELVCDPDRDVLLVRYALSGVAAKVYASLATHLTIPRASNDWSGGASNHGRLDQDTGMLHASGDGRNLCLAAENGFSRTSVGYFGYSDAWQDFAGHGGQMTWSYTDAGPGFIVLSAQLSEASGVLAIAFAGDASTCANLADQSLAGTFVCAETKLTAQWTAWATNPGLDPGLPAGAPDAVQRSATVMKCHQDRQGAIVAGLCSPWGAQKNDPGGYHLVWPRDAVEVALAFVALGHLDDAVALLEFLVAMQVADGSWHQNFYPDGTVYWGGLQLDEVALPILLAAKLDEAGRAPSADALTAIGKAVGFLVRHGPLTDQDRWEEDSGGSPYTLGIIVAALAAATNYLGAADKAYLLTLIDDWNERIEEWCYVQGSYLDTLYGVEGHYVRIGASSVWIKNQANPDLSVPYQGVVGMEFMYLARLGLRPADDARITATLRIVDAFLRRDVGTGVAYYRYDFDGYGEQPDGSDFDGTHGIGRPWPLLAGERGQLAALRGEAWQDQLAALLAMRSDTGLVSEQVWDLAPLQPVSSGASQPLLTGKPTLSATPLVWGHSELVKLALAGPTATPIERLESVFEYFSSDRTPTVAHWRTPIPVVELPAGRDLAIEDTEPFTLHFGHDGWQDVTDRDSAPGPFGLHGVTLTGAETRGWATVDFTRHYDATGWEGGSDHHVTIVPAAAPMLRQHSFVS